MTCREVADFLSDYLSEALPADQRAAFEEHLQDCPECVAYVRSYQETVKVAKEACKPGEPPLEEVPEELLQAILAARRKRS